MSRFAEPQRLSLLSLLLGPIRTLQSWAIPLVIAAFVGGGDRGLGTLAPLLFILVVTVGSKVIEVLRLRWWVASGAFELRSGVLQVETRSIPLDRIQNVDLSEPLLPRALGLAEVSIETAGGAGADIVLRYITRTDALALRDEVASRAPVTVASAESEVLVKVPTSELFVAGATANQIGALIALAGVLWGWAIDLGLDVTDLIVDAGDLVTGVGVAIVVAIVLVSMILVGWVVSIGGTILRYHGFVLTEHGVDLRREHGLLTRTSGVIPIKRVQAVRVERALMRRLVKRATVVADTAGSVTASAETGSGVVAPIVTDAATQPLIERVVGLAGPFETDLRQVSPLAIRRMFVASSIEALLVVGIISIWRPIALAALPVLLVLAYLWARASYKAIGYRIDDRMVVARSGVIMRRTWIVPVSKVQSPVLRSTPFQRRLDLATLSIDTAGPGTKEVTIIDLPVDLARSLSVELSARSARFGLVSDGV